MLFVPKSSTIETMLCRIPVNIDATTIAVTMPTTMPRIVNAERNLCAAMLSNAILTTSIGRDAETLIRISSSQRHRGTEKTENGEWKMENAESCYFQFPFYVFHFLLCASA